MKLVSVKECNSYDLLKCIATFAMILDHISCFFYPQLLFPRAIGRIAYPLFAFCIGYNKSYHIKSWLVISSIIIAFISQFIQASIIASKSSILPAIILVKLTMDILKNHLNSKNIFNFMIVFICSHLLLSYLIQYGVMGILLACCGFIKREKMDEKHNIFLKITIILFAFFEMLNPNFNTTYRIIIAILFIAVYSALANFKIYPIRSLISNFMRFCSRNSLAIYVIHFELFNIINYFLVGNGLQD
jgi:hypothetical protein